MARCALVGYDQRTTATGLEFDLHWQVVEPVGGDYTATLQILAADDAKLAQEDMQPGGVYYPTSLWQPGETLVTRHQLVGPTELPAAATLLVALYDPTDMTQLAPPLRLPLP